MAEFRDRKQLEAWLREQPRAASVVIAARAALRAAAELNVFAVREEWCKVMLLPLLRGTATLWVAAKYPTFGKMLRTGVYAIDVHAAATDAEGATAVPALAAFNFFAAYDAAYTAITADDANAAKAAALATFPFGVSDADAALDAYDTDAAVSADMTVIETGATAAAREAQCVAVAGRPLWPERVPDEIDMGWRVMRDTLLAAGDDWHVWTDWYDAVLEGRSPYPRLDAEACLELEVGICHIAEADWRKGPAHVNGMIQRMIDQVHVKAPLPIDSTMPDVPPQAASSIVPVWENGRLVQATQPAAVDVASPILAAALRALRGEIEQSVADIETYIATKRAEGREPQFDTTPIIYLRGLATTIPDETPPLDGLFRIFHAKDALRHYQGTVRAEWPEFFVARYGALVARFDSIANLSPEWVALTGSPKQPTIAQIRVAPEIAEEFIAILGDPEVAVFVDRSLQSPLQRLRATLAEWLSRERVDPVAEGKEALALDLIEGMNDIIKRLAEAGIALRDGPVGKLAARTGKAVWDGFLIELPKSAKKLGKALAKFTVWGPMMGAGSLFSQYFGWFEPVWHLLKRFLNR